MSRNILLTGSGGFIGKNLKEHLEYKYTLLCPRSYELDLRNTAAVQNYFNNNKIDFIIHCATKGGARGVIDDKSVVEENLAMFNNLKSCLNNNRMIVFGSGAQYNKSQPLKKVKEKDLGISLPPDTYGYSKYLIAKEVEKTENILCLNIFGCYGKYELESRFPAYAITRNLQKQPVIIDKNVVFDYLYIEDLCRIVSHFIENKPKGKVLNITPSQSISLLEIAQMINSYSEYKSDISIKEEGLNNEYTGSNSLLMNEVKDFKFTSYEEGLKDYFNFLNTTTPAILK